MNTAVTPTGIMHEFARAEDTITRGQLIGLGIAAGVVVLLLLLVFRSPVLSLTALLPNLIPVSILFGAMGWLGIPLDASTVVIGGLVLGVAVDDTVHVVSGFERRRRSGLTMDEAVRGTLGEVGHPLVCSTIAVSVGFSVLMVSDFLPIVSLGGLTAGVMILCLAADLTLLPALLIATSRRTAGV